MKLRRFFSICLCLVMVTGCSDNIINNDSETTEITTEKIENTKSKNPVKGGTLTLTMNVPTTLNPLKNEDVTVDTALKLIYEPLFNIDNKMDVQPNIAESFEASGKTVTIKIKDNIYWQDGKAIGADDVIYSLETIQSASINSMYKSCLFNVRYFEQTGDKTLEIYYKEPVGAVGYNLSFPVIPKHYFRQNSNADMNPMGSGCFTMDSYKQGKELKLKSAKGINPEPYIQNVDILIISNEQTRLSAAENGIADVMTIDADKLGTIKSSITSNAKMYTSNLFEYIGFNCRNKIFSTNDLRQAMVYIMPIDNIVKGIYINNITKSITPINPDNIHTITTGVDKYEQNENTANTLILASGLTKADFSFKILVNSENKIRVETAKMLSNAFNNFGMDTEVESVSFTEYQNRLKSGSFDMYIGCTELSPNMNLSQLIGSSGSINFTGYASQKMDNYIAGANSSADFKNYEIYLNELNKFVSYELPVAGIGFKKKALVCSRRIEGEISPVFNNCFYNVSKWFISK